MNTRSFKLASLLKNGKLIHFYLKYLVSCIDINVAAVNNSFYVQSLILTYLELYDCESLILYLEVMPFYLEIYSLKKKIKQLSIMQQISKYQEYMKWSKFNIKKGSSSNCLYLFFNIIITMNPSETHQYQQPPQQIKADPEQKEKELVSLSPSSSSSSQQFDYDDSNQKFFNLSDIKPLDFKAKWLGDTNAVLSKFQGKLVELHRQKVGMREELSRFAQNESRWERSSLMRVNIVLDRKQLYDEYMQRTRKPIEKLHPSLILAICSYISDSAFLALASIRRVSRIFNAIYQHEEVIRLFGERDLGFQNGVGLATLERWCERWVDFRETFLYYKQMQYTVLIPQNSIKDDIEDAVDFINQVYKRAYALRSTHFAYFSLLNRFMRNHRISFALESLTFTDMAVTRKASIVAFSNYLAFNPAARRKDQITKTNCLKMIQLVEDEHYRDSLLINSKLSAFLIDEYNYEFAVFIDTLHQNEDTHAHQQQSQLLYDLVIFHLHNEAKSSLAKEVKITARNPIEIGEVTISFTQLNECCLLSYPLGSRMENEQLERVYLPTFVRDGQFGHCYIYRGQFYYVLLITPPPHSD